MLKKLQNKEQGFTIIEVMIVLVIAAVILLIVFLAVPALQRNSRNTQKKNVAAGILSAAGEWSNNGNGAIPVSTDAPAILALVNTNSIIPTGNLFVQTVATTTTAGSAVTVTAANVALNKATLLTNATCNTTGNGVVAGTSARQVALAYQVEGSGGTATNACVDSGL